MTVGYVEKPAITNTVILPSEEIATEGESVLVWPLPPTTSNEPESDLNPDTTCLLNDAYTSVDADLNSKVDEFDSMHDFDLMTRQSLESVSNTLPENMDVDDIVAELQRQTICCMMDELSNISDFLIANHIDFYQNNTLNTNNEMSSEVNADLSNLPSPNIL